jgi:hypothetical protein
MSTATIESLADRIRRALEEGREGEQQDARSKLAGAELVRAVVATPDRELPARIVALKRKLMETA